MKHAYISCDGPKCARQYVTEPETYGGHNPFILVHAVNLNYTPERLRHGVSHFCSEACMSRALEGVKG